jgi:hypothetical protein
VRLLLDRTRRPNLDQPRRTTPSGQSNSAGMADIWLLLGRIASFACGR